MALRFRVLLALAVLASLISFTKFSHCEGTAWASPDQYIHACYSDIPALFGERDLDKNQWPYTSDTNAVEYPVITGMVMFVTALFTDSFVAYFNINVLLLVLLFIFLVFLTSKIKPEFSYLLPVAPAMIASLFINWDLWAIISMMLAIFWFDRQAYSYSAIAIGISISTKFLPIFLLLPIAFILWRGDHIRELVKYLVTTVGIWLAINLAFIVTTPTGWLRFYKLNLERGADWGSLWLALNQLGLDLANLNYLSLLLLLIGISSIAIFFFKIKSTPTLTSVAFIVLATVMLASKVYSPQYVLWLTPLAIIALTNAKDLPAFWIWQGGEIIYHIAIWQHIALVTGANFGLPAQAYAGLTLLRIATCLYLIWTLAKRALQARNPQGSALDLLFEASKAYP
ncbi:MAG: mannosyltransferase [Actinomycetota bacterium]|nr:mannosyltransferase [Actinomycetota bacterium]